MFLPRRPISQLISSLALAALTVLSIAPPTAGQASSAANVPLLPVAAEPSAVTVYRGRASVTRDATIALSPGPHMLRFDGLPSTIRPESLQARVSGPARIVGVEYEDRPATVAASRRIADLDAKIDAAKRELERLGRSLALVGTREAFIDAVSVRVTGDASTAGGTTALDLDAVRRQFEYVSAEREKLMTERGSLEDAQREQQAALAVLEAERRDLAADTGTNRSALVTVSVTTSGSIGVRLTYLVADAGWTPAYNVRATPDGTAVTLEFDALLAQRTGEDWEGVTMTLSTAEPTVAANPPALDPWFVDVIEGDAGRAPSAKARPAFVDLASEVASKDIADDAAVGGAGPSVTYALPRRVNVGSAARAQQRTRIATIELEPSFVHVALPLLTEAVYIRGELTNTSPYQLLPGPAAIFVGSDYVGPTTLRSVAPAGRFNLYFGIDPAVSAVRQLVSKSTSKTGLLGGGRRTSYEYLLQVDNAAGKPLTVELWDRVPVSRSDQIEVLVTDLTAPLDTAPDYLEEDRPRGLLKWILNVPPTAGGAPMSVTYGLRVVRAKDVEMTGLPE